MTKLFFEKDIPYQLTETEIAAMHAAHPGLEIIYADKTADAAGVDLREVAILVTDLRVPREMAACPKLKWIQLVSAGANQVTNTPLARSDVAVTTASGLHGVPIAQFALAGLLMLVHRMPELGEIQRSRHWPPERWSLRGSLLRGKTAGIYGYGSIGRECARQLHALGMRIVALDPGSQRDEGYNQWPGTGDAEGILPARWFKPTQLREMLLECDVLLVAAPLTPKTAGSIGPAELALLKPGARVVIISRGGIVQERALSDALKSGHLHGAALDCFEQEPPPPDHFLYETPNVIMTPHMAGAFEGFWPAMIRLLTENLQRFHRGQPLLNVTNKQLGY